MKICRLQYFCYCLSLQVGVNMLAAIHFTIAFIVLLALSFTPRPSNPRDDNPMAYLLVYLYLTIAIIAYSIAVVASFLEYRVMYKTAYYLILISFIYWLILCLIAFFGNSHHRGLVCIDDRCGQSMWLISFKKAAYVRGDCRGPAPKRFLHEMAEMADIQSSGSNLSNLVLYPFNVNVTSEFSFFNATTSELPPVDISIPVTNVTPIKVDPRSVTLFAKDIKDTKPLIAQTVGKVSYFAGRRSEVNSDDRTEINSTAKSKFLKGVSTADVRKFAHKSSSMRKIPGTELLPTFAPNHETSGSQMMNMVDFKANGDGKNEQRADFKSPVRAGKQPALTYLTRMANKQRYSFNELDPMSNNKITKVKAMGDNSEIDGQKRGDFFPENDSTTRRFRKRPDSIKLRNKLRSRGRTTTELVTTASLDDDEDEDDENYYDEDNYADKGPTVRSPGLGSANQGTSLRNADLQSGKLGEVSIESARPNLFGNKTGNHSWARAFNITDTPWKYKTNAPLVGITLGSSDQGDGYCIYYSDCTLFYKVASLTLFLCNVGLTFYLLMVLRSYILSFEESGLTQTLSQNTNYSLNSGGSYKPACYNTNGSGIAYNYNPCETYVPPTYATKVSKIAKKKGKCVKKKRSKLAPITSVSSATTAVDNAAAAIRRLNTTGGAFTPTGITNSGPISRKVVWNKLTADIEGCFSCQNLQTVSACSCLGSKYVKTVASFLDPLDQTLARSRSDSMAQSHSATYEGDCQYF